MYLQSNIDKLKARKKELGLTNQQLSKESGVPVGTVNKIFSGATRYPVRGKMNLPLHSKEFLQPMVGTFCILQ